MRSPSAPAALAAAAGALGITGVLLAAALGGAHDIAVWVRLVADLAGMLTLGLAALPLLTEDRATTGDRCLAPLAVVAGLWAAGGAAQTAVSAAQRVGVSVLRVDVGALADVVRSGAGVVLSTVVALVLALWAAVVLLRGSSAPAPTVAVPLAVLGLIAGPATGHLSLTDVGSILVSAHVAAAAWWCGTLAAMALVLRGRGQWAQALPRFSSLALWAVALVGATGVTSALLHSTDFGAAYLRVAIAKLLVLVLLVGLGWHQRRTWLAAASRRGIDEKAWGIDEKASMLRAILEVGAITVAFGLAASLSLTA
ncbi:CopD family protein [Tsukamurella sp. 8F]|uniref:CopD family protein n=1 Tax=unclassified Tsukamurella TaxID=2633480 RepID=UPI0023BA2E57|nr:MULTISPECIES: CopD family protein [unclassified Tsukamurella]MDF0530596.1 CopD family protein [Tsukamurella sp. 8J]MDF0587797.1 CopD family protein [Tsukamurella sp. 8F]